MELRESVSSALPRVDLVVSERPGVREKASPRAGGARGGDRLVVDMAEGRSPLVSQEKTGGKNKDRRGLSH